MRKPGNREAKELAEDGTAHGQRAGVSAHSCLTSELMFLSTVGVTPKSPRDWAAGRAPGEKVFRSLPCGLQAPSTDLFSLLVENGGHVQQGTPLIQGCRKRLPLLLQLVRNLLNLLRGVVARLDQAICHGHYAVYIYIHVLRKVGERKRACQRKANKRLPCRTCGSQRFLKHSPRTPLLFLRAESPGIEQWTYWLSDFQKL